MVSIAPPGDLNSRAPPYPGEGLWTIVNQMGVPKYPTFKFVLKDPKNPNKTKKQTLSIGRGKGEDDEGTYNRMYDIRNYIKYLGNIAGGEIEWLKTQTQSSLCVLLMSATDTRYHLQGNMAGKYGPNSILAHRMEGGILSHARLSAEATLQLSDFQDNKLHDYSGQDITPFDHIDAVITHGTSFNGNMIDKLRYFFLSIFDGYIENGISDLIDPNGNADTFARTQVGMDRLLGGSGAGINLSNEMGIDTSQIDLQHDIIVWRGNASSGTVTHKGTFKYINVPTLMYYNTIDYKKSLDMKWNSKEIIALIKEILGDQGRFWCVSSAASRDDEILTPNILMAVPNWENEVISEAITR